MRDTLVMSHLHLVDGVLFELMSRFPRHVDRENLRAAGLLGLVEASRRFDEETGVPFDRYARVRIRGAMLDATRIGLISTRKARRRRRDLESASTRRSDLILPSGYRDGHGEPVGASTPFRVSQPLARHRPKAIGCGRLSARRIRGMCRKSLLWASREAPAD